MKLLSLFSGVGGFDLGLERAGLETVFQCEWDKNCQEVLKRHWPNVPKWDDVSTLTGKYILEHAPVIDVVAWGSPCQDLSVAGKRAGLTGERSGLFHQGIRIIKELRELTNGQYPRISIWENVAGALSSNNGADFGEILYEMDEAGACFSEWRLLDAQYFGIPQRRRRVFVLSVFDPRTAARCPDPILPILEGLQWDLTKGAKTRESTAGETIQSLGSGSDVANTISSEIYHHGSVVNQDANNGHVVIEENTKPYTPSSFAQYEEGVGTLRSNGGDIGGGSETLVTFTKSRRAQSATDDETWVEGKSAPTLNSFDQGDVRATTVIVSEPILMDGRRTNDVRVYESPVQTLEARMGTGGNNVPMLAFDTQFGSNANVTEDVSPTLKASQQSPSVAYPIQDGREIEKHQNGLGVAGDGDPSYTLDQTGSQAIAYDEYNDALGGDVHHALRAGTKQSTGVVVDNEIVGTLRSGGDGGVPSSRGEHLVTETVMPALLAGLSHLTGTTQDAYIAKIHEVQSTMVVRRLTPLECERLMGWPDNHTLYKEDGTVQADTHRYKQCGNGVASPVAHWIGEQVINL